MIGLSKPYGRDKHINDNNNECSCWKSVVSWVIIIMSALVDRVLWYHGCYGEDVT